MLIITLFHATVTDPDLARLRMTREMRGRSEPQDTTQNWPRIRPSIVGKLNETLAERRAAREDVQARSITTGDIKLFERPEAALNANIAETEAEIVACSSQLLEFDASVSQDTNPYDDEIQTTLRQFGLDEFRLIQYAAITAAKLGRDMLILMPTGSGKSLTFQLPAACASSGLTVVVTPLLALMSNQTSALRQKEIRVVSTDEIAISPQAFERMLRRAFLQPVILYSTPEKLVGHDRMNHLLDKLHAKGRLTRFAVDEAHCLQWGEWRPALDARFGEHIRRRFPGVPITALTATANSAQIADIERTLQLHDHLIFRLPSNRANLAYRVVTKPKKADAMQQLCDEFILPLHNGHTGIIYCAYKHTTTEVTAYLVRRGISARHFNSDLSSDERAGTLEAWMSGEFKVVVATNAFGMGIDKPDVRFVVHFELPRDMTGYIQETGRAGRDGLPADCLFMYSGRDYAKLKIIMEDPRNERVSQAEKAFSIRNLAGVKQYALSTVCRSVALLHVMDELADDLNRCLCDNCGVGGVRGVQTDVTDEAIAFVEQLKTSTVKRSDRCANDFLRGGNYFNKSTFGSLKPTDVFDMMIQQLVADQVVLRCPMFCEALQKHVPAIQLGEGATDFLRTRRPVKIGHYNNTRKLPALANATSDPRPPRRKTVKRAPPAEVSDSSDIYAPDSDPEDPPQPPRAPRSTFTFSDIDFASADERDAALQSTHVTPKRRRNPRTPSASRTPLAATSNTQRKTPRSTARVQNTPRQLRSGMMNSITTPSKTKQVAGEDDRGEGGSWMETTPVRPPRGQARPRKAATTRRPQTQAEASAESDSDDLMVGLWSPNVTTRRTKTTVVLDRTQGMNEDSEDESLIGMLGAMSVREGSTNAMLVDSEAESIIEVTSEDDEFWVDSRREEEEQETSETSSSSSDEESTLLDDLRGVRRKVAAELGMTICEGEPHPLIDDAALTAVAQTQPRDFLHFRKVVQAAYAPGVRPAMGVKIESAFVDVCVRWKPRNM